MSLKEDVAAIENRRLEHAAGGAKMAKKLLAKRRVAAKWSVCLQDQTAVLAALDNARVRLAIAKTDAEKMAARADVLIFMQALNDLQVNSRVFLNATLVPLPKK